MKTYGCQSMVGTLNRAMVKRPQESYIDDGRIDAQWEALAYLGRPDFGQAIEEHRRFVILLEAAGVEVDCLPADDQTGLDSMYTHDPVASVTDQGVILSHMGKEARMEEVQAIADVFEQQHAQHDFGRGLGPTAATALGAALSLCFVNAVQQLVIVEQLVDLAHPRFPKIGHFRGQQTVPQTRLGVFSAGHIG